MAEKEKKAKKSFKMPHLFWIMMGLLLLTSLLTYVIPAGNFGTTADGGIDGNVFAFAGKQSPVSPLEMMFTMLEGLTSSALIGWSVMMGGASVGVVMATGAFDELLNWAIYKLKDKDDNILIIIMFCVMVYLGAFGGSDALVAIVPLGVLFAKKLKLDPICAVGVSTYATLIGFGTGPTKQLTTQMLMEVKPYGTFGTMFISMNVFMIVGLVLLLTYTKKIKKNPELSLMWDEGWRPDAGDVSTDSIKEAKLSGKTVAILLIYFGQYAIMVGYPLITGDNSLTYKMLIAMAVAVSILAGLIGGFSMDKIGNEVAKGISNMAFVAWVIGMAKVMSLVMTNGNILHTIVYWLTRPLMNLPRAVATIGMTIVICLVNLFIPSASSKSALLVPILKPISEVLSMKGELTVQAFQYGDGFTNIVSPFLGWTMGSLATAGVPYTKWLKWALPKVIIFMLVSCVAMFILTTFNWNPF